jgi:hypothetical protein
MANTPTLNNLLSKPALHDTGWKTACDANWDVIDALLVGRNRLINGDMRIDQRNAGASLTPNSAYGLDRWFCGTSVSGKFSVQQNAGAVTAPANFPYYLGITSLSSYAVLSTDRFYIEQSIEGLNAAFLSWGTANAKAVTLSFWVRSSLTGTFGGSLANSSLNRSYPFTYTINVANTWEKKVINVAGDTTGSWAISTSLGIAVRFSLGAGATYSGTAGAWAAADYRSATGAVSVVGTNAATFYLTGVQFETNIDGSIASPFEHRLYSTELGNCMRYAQVRVWAVNELAAVIQAVGASSVIGKIYDFPVPMRTAPTGVVTGGGFISYNSTNGVNSAVTINSLNSTAYGNVSLNGSLASGILTAGDASILAGAIGGATLTLSAEL